MRMPRLRAVDGALEAAVHRGHGETVAEVEVEARCPLHESLRQRLAAAAASERRVELRGRRGAG